MDRRIQRTRKALGEALIALILETGFEAVTVQAIVDKANLARATFYLHYKDKDELLWDTLKTRFDEIMGALAQLDADSLLLSGKPLTYPLFKYVADHASFFRVLFSTSGTAEFQNRLHRYIASTSYQMHAPLRAASPHMSVPPEYIAHFLAGAALGCIRWWLESSTGDSLSPSPEQMAYMFSQLAAPGVLASMGLEG